MLMARAGEPVTLIGVRSRNHPQQVAKRKPNDEVDDRATPWDEYTKLVSAYGPFSIDVAAASHNTKCVRYYDRDTDGLSQPWGDEDVWCNPPYSNIEPWLVKAWDEWGSADPPHSITMLLPNNRAEQGWWQRHVEPLRERDGFSVAFLPGRMRFIKKGATEVGPNERPPFGVCLLLWRTP